jgi:hypothetical protein
VTADDLGEDAAPGAKDSLGLVRRGDALGAIDQVVERTHQQDSIHALVVSRQVRCGAEPCVERRCGSSPIAGWLSVRLDQSREFRDDVVDRPA